MRAIKLFIATITALACINGTVLPVFAAQTISLGDQQSSTVKPYALSGITVALNEEKTEVRGSVKITSLPTTQLTTVKLSVALDLFPKDGRGAQRLSEKTINANYQLLSPNSEDISFSIPVPGFIAEGALQAVVMATKADGSIMAIDFAPVTIERGVEKILVDRKTSTVSALGGDSPITTYIEIDTKENVVLNLALSNLTNAELSANEQITIYKDDVEVGKGVLTIDPAIVVLAANEKRTQKIVMPTELAGGKYVAQITYSDTTTGKMIGTSTEFYFKVSGNVYHITSVDVAPLTRKLLSTQLPVTVSYLISGDLVLPSSVMVEALDKKGRVVGRGSTTVNLSNKETSTRVFVKMSFLQAKTEVTKLSVKILEDGKGEPLVSSDISSRVNVTNYLGFGVALGIAVLFLLLLAFTIIRTLRKSALSRGVINLIIILCVLGFGAAVKTYASFCYDPETFAWQTNDPFPNVGNTNEAYYNGCTVRASEYPEQCDSNDFGRTWLGSYSGAGAFSGSWEIFPGSNPGPSPICTNTCRPRDDGIMPTCTRSVDPPPTICIPEPIEGRQFKISGGNAFGEYTGLDYNSPNLGINVTGVFGVPTLADTPEIPDDLHCNYWFWPESDPILAGVIWGVAGCSGWVGIFCSESEQPDDGGDGGPTGSGGSGDCLRHSSLLYSASIETTVTDTARNPPLTYIIRNSIRHNDYATGGPVEDSQTCTFAERCCDGVGDSASPGSDTCKWFYEPIVLPILAAGIGESKYLTTCSVDTETTTTTPITSTTGTSTTGTSTTGTSTTGTSTTGTSTTGTSTTGTSTTGTSTTGTSTTGTSTTGTSTTGTSTTGTSTTGTSTTGTSTTGTSTTGTSTTGTSTTGTSTTGTSTTGTSTTTTPGGAGDSYNYATGSRRWNRTQ